QLHCRGCNRTPAETRTPVADDSTAYTCAQCLTASPDSQESQEPQEPQNQGGQYVHSGSPKSAHSAPENSETSETVKRPFAVGRGFRPGRPRISRAEKLQRRRE